MAISPQDLRQAKIRNEVKDLEAKIDALLIGRLPEPGVTVRYDLPSSVSQNVISIAMRNYREQGWQVEYHEASGNKHDPCDGLSFKYSLKAF